MVGPHETQISSSMPIRRAGTGDERTDPAEGDLPRLPAAFGRRTNDQTLPRFFQFQWLSYLVAGQTQTPVGFSARRMIVSNEIFFRFSRHGTTS